MHYVFYRRAEGKVPMLHVILWAILAVWVGIALLILLGIVSTLVISTGRLLLDRLGIRGTVWCPVLHRTMEVLGPPAAFLGGVTPFDDIKKCERFGQGAIECHKWCLKSAELAEAAKTN
jgi:hypothetical protein